MNEPVTRVLDPCVTPGCEHEAVYGWDSCRECCCDECGTGDYDATGVCWSLECRTYNPYRRWLARWYPESVAPPPAALQNQRVPTREDDGG